jgi:hypothetical protein
MVNEIVFPTANSTRRLRCRTGRWCGVVRVIQAGQDRSRLKTVTSMQWEQGGPSGALSRRMRLIEGGNRLQRRAFREASGANRQRCG